MAEGRGGVVKQFLSTPPRLRELRWLRNFFLFAHPPLLLLRRGVPTLSDLSLPRAAIMRGSIMDQLP